MFLILQRIIFFLFILLPCLDVTRCKAESFSPFSHPCMQGVDILTGERTDEDEMSHVHYEKYQEGSNQLREESLFLEKGDWRIGKIKTIHSTTSSFPDIHFFYEYRMTKVYEGAEKTKIYHYNEHHLPSCIEYYQKTSSGAWNVLQCERLFWQKKKDSPLLMSRVLENQEGNATACYCFFYNDQGQLIEERLIGDLSRHSPFPYKIDEDGYPNIEGVESYGVKYIYSEEQPDRVIAQVEDSGLKTEYQYNASWQCTALFRTFQEQMLFRHFYFYDQQGFLERAVVDDGQGRKEEELVNATYQQTIHFQLGQQFPLFGKPLKIERVILDLQSSEEKRDEIVFHYDEQGELICALNSRGETLMKKEPYLDGFPNHHMAPMMMWNETLSFYPLWDTIANSLSYCFQCLQSSAHQIRMNWKNESKLPAPLSQSLEKMSKILLGDYYWLMGFHSEETRVDSYGKHEISDKVRVTFINGIINTSTTLQISLKDISESHGDIKVHHVFRPTEGWTWDMARAIAIKTAFPFGFRSTHAYLLAQLWKELIQEMGGVESGGVIIHYAHSLGGSETDRARGLLTPEEQKMIRVITFGSPTLIRNEGFQSVINIVSINDGVSCLDPLGHIRNYFDPDSNVRFYSALHVPPYWPADHMFNGPTYRQILGELGEQFLDEFILQYETEELQDDPQYLNVE